MAIMGMTAFRLRQEAGWSLTGLLVVLLGALLVGSAALSLVPPQVDSYEMEKQMGRLMAATPPLSDDALMQAVLDYAKEREIPLAAGGVTLVRYTDETRELAVRWTVDVGLFGEAYVIQMRFSPTIRK